MGGYDERMGMDRVAAESANFDGRGGDVRMVKSMAAPRIAQADSSYAPDAENRKIIKNGNLSLEVEDTEAAKAEAETLVKEFKGSITNMNSWNVRPNVLGFNLTIRIPSESLDALMKKLSDLGLKTSEGFNSTDITAQYQDTAARIKNLETRRNRLQELLEFETEALKDVLDVDRELSNVQFEIENLQKSQNRRDVDVAYSTLNLHLQPEMQIGDESNPHWSVTKSWKQAVSDLLKTGHALGDKLIKLVVFIPIWVPILLLGWWLQKRFLRK